MNEPAAEAVAAETECDRHARHNRERVEILERHQRQHVELGAQLDADLTRRQQNRELEQSAGAPPGSFEDGFCQRAHAELHRAQFAEDQAMRERHRKERGGWTSGY